MNFLCLSGFDCEFDENNPLIDIPNEVATQIDNDFDLSYKAPDFNAKWAVRRYSELFKHFTKLIIDYKSKEGW